MSDYKDADQLALLMQYTNSHMMIFTGLIAAAAASAYYYLKSSFDLKKENRLPTILLIIAGTCFVTAGIAIGMIASYIPHFKNYAEFVKGPLKLFNIPIEYDHLRIVENYGFWLSILFFILAIGFSKKPSKDESENK